MRLLVVRWVVLMVLIELGNAVQAVKDDRLPVLAVNASSNYQLGFSIGKAFGQRIQGFVKQYGPLKTYLIPFYESQDGRKIFDSFIATNQQVFPHLMEEINGIADGASVPLYIIQLLNLEPELSGVSFAKGKRGIPPSALSCTDLQLVLSPGSPNDPPQLIDAHNEDAESSVKNFAYWIQFRSPVNSTNLTSFQGYNYPGLLIGNAFGFNANGLIFALNAVFPKDAQTQGGIARYFINRQLYNAKSIDDVIRIATPLNRASGFSINLLSVREKRAVNIEVSPNAYAVTDLFYGNYSHANMYKHLSIPQYPDDSTIHRQNRIDQFPAFRSVQEMLTILGDTQDPQYPIYRTGKSPDTNVSTVATVVFNALSLEASIFLDNPKTSPPSLRLPITF